LAGNGYSILLPTDGSYPAIAATIRAVELAKDKKAKLHILKVVESVQGAGMEKIAEDSALMRTAGIDGVAYAKDLAEKNSIPFDVLIKEGAVVGEIIKVANEVAADLIVMGSSTIKGLPGLYLGSVSRGVMKNAPCDVIVVKLTEEEMKSAVELAYKISAAMKAPPIVNGIADLTRTKKFKVGVALFAIYGIGYAVFTLFGTYSRSTFSVQILGMNVGIVSGMLLILVAIIMAICFNWYAGWTEKVAGGK
jgi:nucleotide-binding universal stress UspA family protein